MDGLVELFSPDANNRFDHNTYRVPNTSGGIGPGAARCPSPGFSGGATGRTETEAWNWLLRV